MPQVIEKATTVNELLHVMHSYVENDNDLLVSMPILKNKINKYGKTITLYGEETEIAKKLFEGFYEELDVGTTDIVSFKDKILMMIRDRGHALTVDIDIKDPEQIAVTYFVPKIRNEEMIRTLPGINTSSISSNGATGFFLTSIHEVVDKITDFIERVPIEKGMLCRIDPDGELIEIPKRQKTSEEISRDNVVHSKESVFGPKDAQDLAIRKGKRGPRTGLIKYLFEKLREGKVAIEKVVQDIGKKYFGGDGTNGR